MSKGQRRHDSLVDRVEAELKSRGYSSVHKNVEYSSFSGCGEIDLYAKKDNYVLLFEMKSIYNRNNYKKALKQLSRSGKLFPRNRVFSFYVSNYKNPKIEWIKWKYI